MSINEAHKELVSRAERWLLNSVGCSFVLAELCAVTGCGEIPDAIGWRNGVSILVECKTSRSDFLSDKNKVFRKNPSSGMGGYRFYLCPPGVIKPEDLPHGWGLLYTMGLRIKKVVCPKGNYWNEPPFRPNQRAEIQLLASALRRVHLRGDLAKIYDHKSLKGVGDGH